MNNLLLLSYNNYYNRIIKKLDSALDYMNSVEHYKYFDNINFIPNDGVNTTQIINWKEEWHPDYCIVLTDGGEIVSRWFITESTRTRGQQYNLILKRDSISDYWDNLLDAPIYVNKAKVSSDSSLIFNNEGMNFNQIKSSEKLVKDYTKCAWLVGYIASLAELPNSSTTAYEGIVDTPTQGTSQYTDITSKWYSGLVDGSRKEYSNNLRGFRICVDAKRYKGTKSKSYPVLINGQDLDSTQNFHNFSTTTLGEKWMSNVPQLNEILKFSVSSITNSNISEAINLLISAYYKVNPTVFNNIYNLFKTDTQLSDDRDKITELLTLDGKIVKKGSILYKLHVIELKDQFYQKKYGNGTDSSNAVTTALTNSIPGLKSYCQTEIAEGGIQDKIKTVEDGTAGTITNPNFQLFGLVDNVIITSEVISSNSWKVYIPQSSSGRLNINDECFDMFCMPINVDNETRLSFDSSSSVAINNTLQLSVARTLAKKFGTIMYDLQLLPYCPIRDLYLANIGQYLNVIDIPESFYGEQEGYRFNIITNAAEDENLGVIFWCSSNKGTFNTSVQLDKSIYSDEANVEAKIRSECDMYRLVSPNYNGQFEFNAIKNGSTGSTLDLNVDYTYKPYTPYIHINPVFGRLYGTDYNDARGLICGGDFSVSIQSEAWSNYQLQNKNYLNIFDREIQNMDYNRRYQRVNEAVGAVTGTFSGSLSGAVTGGMAGGPYGAVAGAAIGGGASLAGGLIDLSRSQELYKENKQYKTDLFNMSLQNIQALPLSLAKNSALTYNNKYFPILEYYTCTEIEKQALAKKVTYNGMTINVIGTIRDYYVEDNTQFFQGQLIRLEGVSNNTFIISDIANELAKGVYL